MSSISGSFEGFHLRTSEVLMIMVRYKLFLRYFISPERPACNTDLDLDS
jgi:hypothetical protein